MNQRFGKAPRSLYSLPPSAIGSSPWLVLTHGRHKQIQTFYNPLDGSIHHRSIPEMRQKYCFGCSNGHLMMLDLGSKDCYLLSLTSMETFPLPPLTEYPIWYVRMFVLSSAPSHVDCAIIIVKNVIPEDHWEHEIFICKPYEKEWRSLYRIRAFQFGAITNGIADSSSDGNKVYLHSCSNKLLVVDTRSLHTQEIDVEEIHKSHRYTNKQTLFQSSDGDLFVLKVNQTLSENFHSAEVYRLNNSKSSTKCWERLESINDRAIFVGEIGAAYFVNDARVKHDRIYFMRSSVNGMGWYRFALAQADIILHKLFRPNPLRISYKSTYLAMT